MPGLESSSGSERADSESDTHGLVKQANAMAGIRGSASRTASHYVAIYMTKVCTPQDAASVCSYNTASFRPYDPTKDGPMEEVD